MTRLSILLVGSALVSNAALATELPDIEFYGRCKSYAIEGRVDVKNVEKFCIERNLVAQQQLIKKWDALHDDVRAKCAGFVPDSAFPYLTMLSCVVRGEAYKVKSSAK